MRLLNSIFVLLWTFSSLIHAKSIAGDRVLVILEDAAEKESYSQFWTDLESRDFKLSFESPKDTSLNLFKLGAPAYDHVILFPPQSKGYGPNLTPKSLLSFTNAGGNILLALSPTSPTPSAIAALLLEFDISLSTDRSAYVVDHFHHDTLSSPSSSDHNVVLLPRPQSLRPDVMNFFGGDGILAVPNAIGQSLGNISPLIAPILRAPETAYTHNPKQEADDEGADKDGFATGSQIALISALQARNSARFTILGSLEMLQNKWFDAEVQATGGKSAQKTVNRQFAQQLTEWTFKEVGVLKVGRVAHQEVLDASKPVSNVTEVGFADPEIYRIKTDVTFSIDLSIWDKTHFVPYIAPATDNIQLEFSMLSPFHRLALQPTTSTSSMQTYSTTFRTPDQHGIFAFKVNYKRPFLTNIEERRQVTVRHFAHDEWPRSYRISGAWPWISGLWAVIGGFLAFCVIWLYCEPPKEDIRRKLRQETNTT